MNQRGQADNEFPVQWDDPADAERSWQFDLVHTPDVMTPLGFDLYYDPFARGFGMGLEPRLVNCYVFTGRDPNLPNNPQLPPIDLDALRQAGKRWQEELIPEIVRLTEHYRLTDFDSMAEQDLIDELDKLRELRVRGGQLHTQAMLPWMMGMNHLVDTYQELTGGDDVSAMRLVQGYGNKSVDAGHALWELSRLANSIPSVREQVQRASQDTTVDVMSSLKADPDAEPFLQAFSSFLDQYGWRADLFELSSRTWAEDPTIPLGQMRAYLELEGYDPTRELEKLGAQREEAIEAALAGLEGEAQTQLRDVIDMAAQLIAIQEDHNFYIDQRLAYMPRRLTLAAGRRLVSKSMIDDPADVFYLHADELNSGLAGTLDGLSEIVGRRKSEMSNWADVTPPSFIGAEPPETPAIIRRFQGKPQLRSERPGELTGNSASAGVARGPARVLLSLSEADRLKPGDVLIARTTMPAWTPLFAVASAIVTESGGVLSHAAVVAREYGIPAVLSVTDATRLIQDGQLVEVDGQQGIVRILS